MEGPIPAGEALAGPAPLDGVLVVSLEQAVAAPYATRKLADAGARVLKVERPGGDFARRYDAVARGQSAYFAWLNRGKESVVVDIKSPEDAELLRRMVARADVFLQNLAPGAAERAGFGSAELRRRHARLVTCDISGYGEEGPYAGMKAYDNLLQAEAGLHAVTGHPDGPARVGISICDIGAGIHAYGAILEALLRRERTGEGTGLEVSLFSSAADWMSVPYLHAVYGGAAPERSGLRHPSIAPYGPFRSGDGSTVMIAVQNEREWEALCRSVLQRDDLAADPRFASNTARVEHREELRAVMEEELGDLSTTEILQRLAAGRIAHGRLRSVEEFAAHPQLRVTGVETPGGEVRLPADPVVRRPGFSPRPSRVPAAGEDDVAVRREFSDGEA